MTDHDKPMSMVEREIRARFLRVSTAAVLAGAFSVMFLIHLSVFYGILAGAFLFFTIAGIYAESAALTESK